VNAPDPSPTARPGEPEQGPRPAVLTRGLSKTIVLGLGLQRRTILSSIDLKLEHGARLGLIGPNGSGKSTLLEIIAGVERASKGSVEVFGGNPARGSIRSRVGFLPEESPFPAELTARTALELLGSLQGLDRKTRRARAEAMLVRVGLGAESRTHLGRFSRGMLRRFGLAQAFQHEPNLLLLDEPTAGLDATGFVVFESLLEEATARGSAVILASHRIEDVLTPKSSLAVLVDGHLIAQGSPQEVLGDAPDTHALIEIYRSVQDGQQGAGLSGEQTGP